MRLLAGLLCILAHAVTLNANVEKTIFLAPGPVTLPNVDADSSSPFTLDTLHLDELDPASRYILPTRLLVQFPTELAPRGLESWYQLHALDAGRRYEVRICWPATVSLALSLLIYPPLFESVLTGCASNQRIFGSTLSPLPTYSITRILLNQSFTTTPLTLKCAGS